MTRSKVYWAVTLGLLAATVAASAWLYPSMPDRVPTHWNIKGQVDGYSGKAFGLFLTPAILAAMVAFFAAMPYLSPKNFEVDSFHDTYLFLMAALAGLLAYLHGVILYKTWQHTGVPGADANPDIGRLLMSGIFLFLALIGNVMGKVRRNFWIGIRVPWTLASDRVWNDTHRLAAWTMVGGGLLGFLLVVAGAPVMLAFALLMVAMLVPVVYSFVHYKRLERRGAL